MEVSVSVLAFAKVSFNIQRLSTVGTRRLYICKVAKNSTYLFFAQIRKKNLTGKEHRV